MVDSRQLLSLNERGKKKVMDNRVVFPGQYIYCSIIILKLACFVDYTPTQMTFNEDSTALINFLFMKNDLFSKGNSFLEIRIWRILLFHS